MVSLIAKDVKLSYNVRARTDARPATRTPTHLLEGVAHGDSYSSQAARGSCCHGTASSLSTVQQAAHFLLAARNPRRPRPKQTRAYRRKCPFRHQLIILRRQVKRPACTRTDRILLVLLAKIVRSWKQALVIVQPETLLRWHRQGYKLFWRYKSRAMSAIPKISAETVALIKEMARDNRLWGAERIRGELLKLGIHVCKRTIQKYMRQVRTTRPRGQMWSTFLHSQAQQIWACDFLPVTDLFFRSLAGLLRHRAEVTEGDPRRRDTLSHRRVDGTTATGSHCLWCGAEVSHPG